MATLKQLVSILMINFLWLQISWAGDVSGQITFDSGVPFVAVVYFKDGGKQSKVAVVDQKNKVFIDKAVIVVQGDAIEFKNSDDLDHNIFANDTKAAVKFDVGLINPGQSITHKVTWNENSLVRIGCKIHPKMRMYLANVPNRFAQIIVFEKSNKEYSFTLSGVPEDVKQFTMLIPKYDPIELELVNGKAISVDIIKKAKKRGQITITKS